MHGIDWDLASASMWACVVNRRLQFGQTTIVVGWPSDVGTCWLSGSGMAGFAFMIDDGVGCANCVCRAGIDHAGASCMWQWSAVLV